jgi:hypothetical protein
VSKTNRAQTRDVRRLQRALNIPYSEARASVESPAITRREWFELGWARLLPDEANYIDMGVVKAHVLQRDGAIEELIDEDLYRDALQAPLIWTTESSEDAVVNTARDIAQAAFTYAVERAGLRMPETIRELAFTLAEFGLYTCATTADGSTRWRLGKMARPIEMLKLPETWIQLDEEARWKATTMRPSHQLLSQLVTSGQFPQVSTTIERLASEGDLTEVGVRLALDGLVYNERLDVRRGNADVQRSEFAHLPPHARLEVHISGNSWAEELVELMQEDRDPDPGERISWAKSPWQCFTEAAQTEHLSEDACTVLAHMPFQFRRAGRPTRVASLEILAAEMGVSRTRLAEGMLHLEEAGLLTWIQEHQEAELRSMSSMYSIRGLQ